MLFNTPQYILFLPLVVLLYYCLPRKVRYIWLLIVSYYFYMQWNPLYVTLLFSCTLLTYVSALIIEKINFSPDSQAASNFSQNDKFILHASRTKQRICLALCILLNLCVLGFFKYFYFGIDCLNHLLRLVHLNEVGWNHDILLPVGISFYTLQALGYLIDVYRGDIRAEKNFLKYALFVSFFPQLVAGPIERSKNLLTQLQGSHSLQYENIRKGMLLVLYGLFLKMVIADRAAMIVDTVYNNSETYAGFYIVVATCFFAIQIYCDFYGYSTIARGSALLMGIRLTDNFNAPYFSKSVKEFWRRWHISLSGWFRDYLYIPLGGNRKGRLRKDGNLLTVFAVSGLWHGASFSFIFWGLLNGIYQVAEGFYQDVKQLIGNHWNVFLENRGLSDNNSAVDDARRFCRELSRTIFTFGLVTFAWLFFRAGGLSSAYEIITNMLHIDNWMILFDGSLYELGVAKNYMNALIVSILILFLVDYQKYQGKDAAEWLLNQRWAFRIFIYMFLIFTILLYGCYGELYDTQQFIYFQF